MELFGDILLDALIDTAKLIPFLFLTYLAMEYLEHKAGSATERVVKKAGKWGPALGAGLGVVPQCGFSAAATNLYAGRVITLGTLIAIYLSTSDEMLPILISAQAGGQGTVKITPLLIAAILLIKVVVGMIVGFGLDFALRNKTEHHEHIHEMCENEKCHCERGILWSAVLHTFQIAVYILILCFILGWILELVGMENLSGSVFNNPFIGSFAAALVGLIPNCASSVAITQLYTQGALGFGSMMSGLLVNAGVGLLVLFRVNHHRKENLKIVGILYASGVVFGLLSGLIGNLL